jgi:ATP-binding cassette subfamily B protein
VFVPQTLKLSLDALTPQAGVALSVPVFFIVCYGALRLLSRALVDMQETVFVHVVQHATRTASLRAFDHLHALPLRYHQQRRTGGVLRAVDRGSKAIGSLVSFLLFNIAVRPPGRPCAWRGG